LIKLLLDLADAFAPRGARGERYTEPCDALRARGAGRDPWRNTDRVLVRPVRAADVAALVPLRTEWGHPQVAAVVAAQGTEWEQTPLADVVVAEVSGEVVGVVAVCAAPHLGRPGRFARVMGLVVASTGPNVFRYS
jgi:hypothetical protein